MIRVTFISADDQEQIVNVRGGVSVQEAAIQNDVIGIDADCGGGCSCATCHVFVEDEWCEKVGPPGDLEASMLELVPGSSKNSRLSCQIKLNDSLDGLVVRTPETQEGC
ncbi:MAG: 2Fe-2S iron-sulfur cluster-binding protein [Porticoccaceae bacterium]|nr:2Fe-2S iron-sulfur cluster binding domain-containing protein [Pseudomonadales bacterium]MCP5172182.1 2Fe-2S iron-sulfur cluster binding domain-containing protein [Pseudomonadales bacterium]